MAKRTGKTTNNAGKSTPGKTARKPAAGKTTRKQTRAVASRSTQSTRKAKAKTATALAEQPAEPTFEQIRARAYELYLARGGRPGDPAADWLQAEQELRAERRQK